MAKPMNETQKRVRVIEKLIDEEEVKKLTPNGLLKSDNISFEEVLLIYELQESVKKNRVFSFLAKKDD